MDLGEIRARIDEGDEQLLKLFLERMELSGEVARYKGENGMAIRNPQREREVLERVRAESGDLERYSNSLFNELFELSRSYQARLLAAPSKTGELVAGALEKQPAFFPQTGTVAVQGVEGAFAQQAADRMFPRGNLVYVKTFEAVFDAVEGGLCQFGMLPIENSSYGSVRAVYDLLLQHHVSIVRSERIWVQHELLAKPGTNLEDIVEIHSHDQALGQCSEFIAKLGPKVKAVAEGNTAESVRMVAASDRAGIAAIGSKYSGELYGLEPVASGIQNSENNYTRFICIAKGPIIYPGANRISLVVAAQHRPGALYEVLGTFAALGINLLKLESCPIPGRDFEFMFFFDLEASVAEPGVIEMLGELEQTAESLTFLGNYQEV